MDPDTVQIASDASTLPPDVAALLDPAVPLPAGVRFFETRFDVAYVARTLLLAAGFALAALVIVPFGVLFLFEKNPSGQSTSTSLFPIGFGLLCGLVSYLMFASAGTCWGLRDRQRRGEDTRRGTFVMSARLIQASEHDTVIIPPTRFRGIDRDTITYDFKDARKTFRLSPGVVGTTTDDRRAAIAAWAAPHVATPPPMIR